MNEKEIQRTDCIRFLGVVFNENLIWNNHMHLIENKISKNIVILYKTKHAVDNKNNNNNKESKDHTRLL